MLSHSWRWYDFSKIQIFGLKAHMLSLTTNTVGCFSCNDWLTLFIFQKISAKYLRFNNHSFVSHSFQWKWCSVKKKKINQASSRFKQPSWISACGISALRILPMSSRRMLKRRAREEQDLIKLITLTAWSRIFLSASEFFFDWERTAMKNTPAGQCGGTDGGCSEAPAVWRTLRAEVNATKKDKQYLALLRNYLA